LQNFVHTRKITSVDLIKKTKQIERKKPNTIVGNLAKKSIQCILKSKKQNFQTPWATCMTEKKKETTINKKTVATEKKNIVQKKKTVNTEKKTTNQTKKQFSLFD